MDSLSLAQARRIALAAQGFTDPAPTGVPNLRHLRRVVGRTGLLQMDSVNVLQRAHYLPLYSRLGPYPTELLDRAAYRRPRELFEYWGHEASLIPVALHPALRWRMAAWRTEAWGGMRRVADRAARAGRAGCSTRCKVNGPLTAAEIEHDAPRRKDNWGWNWSEVKQALEYLFYAGEVTAAARNGAFARLYDLPERVLPADVLAAPTPTDAEAFRTLVGVAARSLGVAAEFELRDYFRLPVAARPRRDRRPRRRRVSCCRSGWRAGASRPTCTRRPSCRAGCGGDRLISPFDPLIWERARTERLFGFFYRIEIYVPAPKRVHGYYVLPFLQGDRFTARVDLKADRKAGVLRIPAAWSEPDVDPVATAAALAVELRRLAGWLGLSAVAPPERGDLAGPLTAALAGERPGCTVIS